MSVIYHCARWIYGLQHPRNTMDPWRETHSTLVFHKSLYDEVRCFLVMSCTLFLTLCWRKSFSTHPPPLNCPLFWIDVINLRAIITCNGQSVYNECLWQVSNYVSRGQCLTDCRDVGGASVSSWVTVPRPLTLEPMFFGLPVHREEVCVCLFTTWGPLWVPWL